MCDYARQAAGLDAVFLFHHGAALQKNHFSIYKAVVSGAPCIEQKRVACRLNVERHAFSADGNILGAGSGAGGFGKIKRLPGPKHIRLSGHYLPYVFAQCLIVADGHFLYKILVRFDFGEPVVFTEFRFTGFRH